MDEKKLKYLQKMLEQKQFEDNWEVETINLSVELELSILEK